MDKMAFYMDKMVSRSKRLVKQTSEAASSFGCFDATESLMAFRK